MGGAGRGSGRGGGVGQEGSSSHPGGTCCLTAGGKWSTLLTLRPGHPTGMPISSAPPQPLLTLTLQNPTQERTQSPHPLWTSRSLGPGIHRQHWSETCPPKHQTNHSALTLAAWPLIHLPECLQALVCRQGPTLRDRPAPARQYCQATGQASSHFFAARLTLGSPSTQGPFHTPLDTTGWLQKALSTVGTGRNPF